ncbi:MAG: hypothetical protein A3F43_02275 [Gammaproteobacteria bacterium RIFCSPHIGHO2_12_FULL_42_10]|nr:MAG: hypothetical protein A3F43_02275 [Gammaproteobacteria bacterium RIFCSPHIGHO2_12_FULL_42_10]
MQTRKTSFTTAQDRLFCYFTGYTKGMIEITDIKIDEVLKIIHFSVYLPDKALCDQSHYIQLDGVLCQILEKNEHTVTVSTTFELIENTTLKNAVKGTKVCLGILAEAESVENQAFLIHPSATTSATVENVSILSGHRYTVKIDLSCETAKTPELVEEKHVGIAGSSLLVRELKISAGLSRFSIYSSRETRENTRLNQQQIKHGDVVNITLPKIDSSSETPYPFALQSLRPQ